MAMTLKVFKPLAAVLHVGGFLSQFAQAYPYSNCIHTCVFLVRVPTVTLISSNMWETRRHLCGHCRFTVHRIYASHELYCTRLLNFSMYQASLVYRTEPYKIAPYKIASYKVNINATLTYVHAHV